MDLKGKNVIYVGGFGGIGWQSCKNFLSKGIANLSIFDLVDHREKLCEIVKKFPTTNVFYMKVDITNKTEIEDAYKDAFGKMGHFDVVVNGSGIMRDRQIELTVQVNLLGVIYSTLAAIPYMDKSDKGRGGVILNISSVAGIEPCAVFAIYAATKYGVTGFTRSLSHEIYFKRTNISFITFCPGFTDTSLVSSPKGIDTFVYSRELTEKVWLSKRQKPEECAAHLVKAVEICKNGSVWLSDLGELIEIELPVIWKPTF